MKRGTLDRHGGTLHANEAPLPVPTPGTGRTRTGRLWTYARDGCRAASRAAPGVVFRYAANRKCERPAGHKQTFQDDPLADGYVGFNRLYGERIGEVASWPHVRRKFFDVHAGTDSATACEALNHIAGLYAVEQDVRGRHPDKRGHAR